MRKPILVLTFLFYLFAGCDTGIPVSTDLRGTWNWKGTCWEFGCHYPSTDGPMILVIDDANFEYHRGDSVQYSATYRITSDSLSGSLRFYQFEMTPGNATYRVTVQNNHLTTSSLGWVESEFDRIR